MAMKCTSSTYDQESGTYEFHYNGLSKSQKAGARERLTSNLANGLPHRQYSTLCPESVVYQIWQTQAFNKVRQTYKTGGSDDEQWLHCIQPDT